MTYPLPEWNHFKCQFGTSTTYTAAVAPWKLLVPGYISPVTRPLDAHLEQFDPLEVGQRAITIIAIMAKEERLVLNMRIN